MIENLLRALPELVIKARNDLKIDVCYLLCIAKYKYATNTENSFGQIRIIINQKRKLAVTTLRRQIQSANIFFHSI